MNVFRELKVGKALHHELSEALIGGAVKYKALEFALDYPNVYQKLKEGKLKIGVNDGKE